MASAQDTTEFKPPPAKGLAYNVNAIKIPLEDKYYNLDETDVQFWSSQTGLTDPDALKEHILTVQKEAYEVRISFGF